VFYQIYPQSFFDANGDGIGDLNGIEAKLPYLQALGINALWLNPCFVSPFKDAGYDVSDFLRIAPRYGDNSDLCSLLGAAHACNIRVCLDLVAGHTSDQHPWFQASCRPEPNAYSDRYIWTTSPWVKRDGEINFISGTTDRNGSFAINFFAHQPALNYGFAHPKHAYQQPVDAPGPQATRQALKDIMAFWLDLGVDGFRVDMAASLVREDPEQAAIRALWQDVRHWMDAHYPERVLIAEWGDPATAIDSGFHVDFMLHFGTPGYDALFLDETTFPSRQQARYFDSSGQGDFRRFWRHFNPHWQAVGEKGFLSLPSSNHDVQRPAAGSRSAEDLKVVFTFLLTWPQVPFIYYGDEIGLRYLDGLISKEGGYERTGSRTPMQWDGSPLAGFSTNPEAEPYLPLDPDPLRPTVAAQMEDADSLWRHVQQLIFLRQNEADLRPRATLDLLSADSAGYPLVYRRGEKLLVALNPSREARKVQASRSSGDVVPILTRRCALTHNGSQWTLSIGPRGYGVFQIE